MFFNAQYATFSLFPSEQNKKLSRFLALIWGKSGEFVLNAFLSLTKG